METKDKALPLKTPVKHCLNAPSEKHCNKDKEHCLSVVKKGNPIPCKPIRHESPDCDSSSDDDHKPCRPTLHVIQHCGKHSCEKPKPHKPIKHHPSDSDSSDSSDSDCNHKESDHANDQGNVCVCGECV
jgi:hypothetical protein